MFFFLQRPCEILYHRAASRGLGPMEVCESKSTSIDLNEATSSIGEVVDDSTPSCDEKQCDPDMDESFDRAECADRIEAMLSTARMQHEDIWNLLMLSASEGLSYDAPYTSDNWADVRITPEHFFTIKRKLENSINWCSLAQKRLKGIRPPVADSDSSEVSRRQLNLTDEKSTR